MPTHGDDRDEEPVTWGDLQKIGIDLTRTEDYRYIRDVFERSFREEKAAQERRMESFWKRNGTAIGIVGGLLAAMVSIWQNLSGLFIPRGHP